MTHPSQMKNKTLTSKEQREMTTQIVSQASANDMAAEINNPLDEFNNTPIPETTVGPEDESKINPPDANQDDVARLAEVVTVTKGSVVSKDLKHINDLAPIDVDDFLSASIIARPLVLPNHLDQRARDPKYRLRWINAKANGGARFEQCLAAGFRVAKKEEVVGVNPQLNISSDGIRYHDTILMIIEAERLLGAYKYNFQRSLSMVSKDGAMASANKLAQGQFGKDINGLNNKVPAEYMKDAQGRDKVKFYIPE